MKFSQGEFNGTPLLVIYSDSNDTIKTLDLIDQFAHLDGYDNAQIESAVLNYNGSALSNPIQEAGGVFSTIQKIAIPYGWLSDAGKSYYSAVTVPGALPSGSVANQPTGISNVFSSNKKVLGLTVTNWLIVAGISLVLLSFRSKQNG